MAKIEGLFAEGKFFHGQDRAKYRGIKKVQIQAYLTASVQNLKRLMAFGLGDSISILIDLAKTVIQQKNFQKSKIFCAA